MDNFRDSYFQVDWDLTSKRLKGTYWGKQYDTGRGFAVTVINGGQVVAPSTEVLRLKWEKPDNTTGYVNATIVNGKFIVENIDQMFTVHGSVRADFELSVGGEFVASITFYVTVEKAVAVNAIESSSDFTALQAAIATADGIDAQLAHKANDSEVRKKSVPIGLNDVTSELLTSIQNKEGETTFNLLSKPRPRSVGVEETTFLNTGKNLFNKNNAILGKQIGLADGKLIDDSSFFVYELSVQQGDTITISTSYRVAYYGPSGGFLSVMNSVTNSSEPRTIVIPSGVYIAKISSALSSSSGNTIDNFQIEYGSISTEHEEFQLLMKELKLREENIPPLSTEKLKDKSVTVEKTDFFELGKNLLNPLNLITGSYVNSATGTVIGNADYALYHLIPIEPNTSCAYNFRSHIAFYDVNKNFISGIANASGVAGEVIFTTPTTAAFVSLSTKTPKSTQLEYGTSITDYEPYGFQLKKLLIPSSATSKEEVIINLPDNLYATVNEEFTVYTASLLKEKESLYNVNYDASFGSQQEGRFVGTPSNAGTETLSIEIYDRSTLIARKSVNIIVSSPRTTPLRVMLIGDSTVRGNGFGYVTQRLKDKLGDNIELIGSIGTAPNLWEGRGGWTAARYRTGEEYEGVVNPFYNPSTDDFDIGYYLTNQGVSDIDVVIIQLGINDVFSPTSDNSLETRIEEVEANFDHILNNIQEYDSNINVAVNLTIPPNASQGTFGASYFTNQVRWRYKYNNFEWVNKTIERYQGIYDLISVHASLDTENNIVDGVHPKIAGYNQIADVDVSYLNSLT